MRNNRARSRRWPISLVILSAAMLCLTPGPAGATGESGESGAAAGVGTETMNAEADGLPICLSVTDDSSYTVNAPQGTVTASNSAVRYTGPLTITLDPVEPYWINPAGVFSNSSCTNPLGVTATISVTSPGGEVTSCGSSNATYVRANTNVVYHGHGNCTVNGAQAGTNTSHEFVGNLIPCLPFPGEDPVTCGAAQIQGVYAET